MDWRKVIKSWWKVGLVWLVVGVVYSGVVKNGLVWDDLGILENNPYLARWRDAAGYFTGGNYTEGGAEKFGGKYYKPVLSLWLMVNYKLWGGVKPGGFHVMQVWLHMVNIALVYWLVKELTQNLKLVTNNYKLKRKTSVLITDEGWVAFWVALVWGVHPMNVESVAYISAAQEPLYSFFCLLGLLMIVKRKQLIEIISRNRQQVVGSRQKRIKQQELRIKQIDYDGWIVTGLSSLLWLVGLLSKESAIVLPVIVGGYLWLVENDCKLLKKYVRGSVMAFGVYVCLRLGVAGIGFFEPHSAVPIINASLSQRLMSLPYVLVSYLRVLVFPRDLFIGNYKLFERMGVNVWVYVLVLVGLLVMVWRWWQHCKMTEEQRRVWLWLGLWVAVGFGLVSGVVGLDMTFAERWMYFPSIGLVILIGLGVYQWLGGVKSRGSRQQVLGIGERIKFMTISLIVLVLILGWRSCARVGDWRDGLTLYGHDWPINERYRADGYDLVSNLGLEMQKLGKTQEAKKLYEESVAMNPNWWVAYNNLGVYYHNLPDYEKAKEYYRLSISKGNYYLAWENLAVVEAVTRDPELPELVNEGLEQYPKNERLLEVKKYSDQLEGNGL